MAEIVYGYTWENDRFGDSYYRDDSDWDTQDLAYAIILSKDMRLRVRTPQGYHWQTLKRFLNDASDTLWHCVRGVDG